MTETILEKNMPIQIKVAYQSPIGYNEVEIKFEELSNNSVRQVNNSYFKLKGVMRFLGPLMKGAFKNAIA